jgi:hypothetical protein
MKLNKSRNIFIGIVGVLTICAIVFLHIKRAERHRDDCTINIRNVQAGMRGYMGMYNYGLGQIAPDFSRSSLIGPDKYLTIEPICPAGGTYTWIEGRFPELGELTLRCSIPDHVPEHTSNW